MIFYDIKRGLSFQESYESLHKAFGPIAPAKSTGSMRHREFGFGRDREINRPGRPTSSTMEENAARVKQLITDDARITTRDIGHILGIGMSTVNTLLHKHLGVHKRCARWVPHKLTEVGYDGALKCQTNMTQAGLPLLGISSVVKGSNAQGALAKRWWPRS